ncbi:MAG: formylglycine-generating enzyme family protein [Ignavibacteriales bacterium]|nr:MAG: formylglycine-generating enzyme family protein [Ignavibacteriaceae bacterium]MBW7874342.1 formylglycine-generating enzyme family protein [Ignavibacteria bacterium]MCZ2142022.1 formylglycine-generating enzyme family protein [Ignavibacteriales bacterium]MBV6444465.1 Hercynine oxygenase [Ignavibacteriaceae bacterium]MBZ0196784.1 formylglycine-generating enzyme family protein [Ignavibacteriaceae bacterium]
MSVNLQNINVQNEGSVSLPVHFNLLKTDLTNGSSGSGHNFGSGYASFPPPNPKGKITVGKIFGFVVIILGVVLFSVTVYMLIRELSSEETAQKPAAAPVKKEEVPEGYVFVEGGTFLMGCTSEQGYDCWQDEYPAHEVTLSDFYISKYEVTQAQWDSIMPVNPSFYRGASLPVELISWYDAIEFCNKLSEKEGLKPAYSGTGTNITCNFYANGYRLPTEAEWEYAARGGRKSKNFKYSGSNNIDLIAWYAGNSGYRPHDVGTKLPNELGIYDMTGNVWEWCWDWKVGYSSRRQTNPIGGITGDQKALRGGSWFFAAQYARVSNRGDHWPVYGRNNLGFRLVRTKL